LPGLRLIHDFVTRNRLRERKKKQSWVKRQKPRRGILRRFGRTRGVRIWTVRIW